jgi:hypothetical protein
MNGEIFRCSVHWEQLLSLVGDQFMSALLTSAIICRRLERGCLLQISGPSCAAVIKMINSSVRPIDAEPSEPSGATWAATLKIERPVPITHAARVFLPVAFNRVILPRHRILYAIPRPAPSVPIIRLFCVLTTIFLILLVWWQARPLPSTRMPVNSTPHRRIGSWAFIGLPPQRTHFRVSECFYHCIVRPRN